MRQISINVVLGDTKASLVGTFIPGKRSNNYYEPDDPTEFEVEQIIVGGQDLYEFLAHCQKDFIDGSQTDVIDWLVQANWDKIVEAGNCC